MFIAKLYKIKILGRVVKTVDSYEEALKYITNWPSVYKYEIFDEIVILNINDYRNLAEDYERLVG